ncbi:MAG TPA: tRNA 2-thiocytidine(32) synthetase TtcA [Nitrospirota bacterium]
MSKAAGVVMGLEKSLLRKVGRAIGDYGMIADKDRIMVALSGGKDSWTLLYALESLRRKAPVGFSIIAVSIDPGFPGFRSDVVEKGLKAGGFEYHIERSNIYGAITDNLGAAEEDYCRFCARFRRGILYRLSGELGATKIALGHHADDLIETFLMSAMYNGEIRTMPPVLHADDGVNVVIRPLCYVPEKDTAEYVRQKGIEVIGCGCPVCGGSAMRRKRVKFLLAKLEEDEPGIKDNMLAALGNLKPRFLLDRRFY